MTIELQTRLAERLALLAAKHDVPGVQAAIRTGDGDVVEAAAGVLNVETGAVATPASVFQIGSITKAWTATLVMRLVDEGLIDLDAPVTTYLPSFRIKDSSHSDAVTIRHLLSHTSGIDGDLFLDTGRGEDNLERYVEAMAELSPVHPVGATMSYCNSGYSLLGRIVEVLRGRSFDAVLREELFAPLGLASAGMLPEEALRFGAAVGHHKPAGSDAQQVVPAWGIYRSCGPAGLIHATPREVLTFAALHLAGGVTADGTRVLSAASVAAMRTPQVEIPDPFLLGTHWGLGWILNHWTAADGSTVPLFGHDGATLGQGSFLRIFPTVGVAIAVGTNGGHGRELFEALESELVAELVGAEPRPRPVPLDPAGTAVPADVLAARVGVYAREAVTITVREQEGGLVATYATDSPLGDDPPLELELLPAADGFFVTRLEADGAWMPVVLFDLPDGSSYLHLGARSTPRR